MKLDKLKTAIIAIFLFLFIFTLFYEQNSVTAQVDDKDDAAIKSVADYKNWQRINKTSDVPVTEKTDVLEVSDSSVFG